MEGVLDVGRRVGLVPQPLGIAFVFREQQFGLPVAIQQVLAQLRVAGPDDARPRGVEHGLGIAFAPRPGVAEPQRRQQAQARRFRPAVVDGDPDQHVFRPRLGVFHEHVEVPVFGEGAGVEQFILEFLARAAAVDVDQVGVGEFPLRILVEVLHVGVRRRAVEVEVVLLHVFAVVRLAVGEPEQALLQDGIALVPQREGEAQPLLLVADAPQPVLAPAVSPRPGLVVRKIVPGVAVRAVVLAHGAPLPLAEIGTPFFPRDARFARFIQAALFGHVVEKVSWP